MVKIGSEYVIAHALIKAAAEGKDAVPIHQVRDFGNEVQKRCNKDGVDALVIRGECAEAISSYPQFFHQVSLNGVDYVQRSCDIETIKHRFLGYLPPNVLVELQNTPLPSD